MIRLLAHPLTPPPVSQLSLFLSLPVCRRSSLLTGGGGGGKGVATSQILPGEEARPSTNHSILSDVQLNSSTCHTKRIQTPWLIDIMAVLADDGESGRAYSNDMKKCGFNILIFIP
jgi:hypothetical protein